MSTLDIVQTPVSSTTLVSNGLVDFRGNIADKRNTGGWSSAFYVIVEETAEKLAFYSIVTTLGNYLISVTHFPLAKSRDTVTNWVGIGNFLTLVGAFLADAYLGRFMTIFGGSFIYAGVRIFSFHSFKVSVIGYQKPMGSPLTRFAQVIVAACRSHREGRNGGLYEVKTEHSDISGAPKMSHTEQYRFLDKAARTDVDDVRNRWRLCTVTQVEEFKCVIRLMPIVVTTTALAISFSQLPTYFTLQSTVMNRKVGPDSRPITPGMVTIFAALNPIVVIPFYVRLVVPVLRRFTGHPSGITSLQRIGVGLFISIFAMGIAATVARIRLDHPDPKSMSFFWLSPQVFLMGTAEVFAFVGLLEFFYDQSSPGTRSICTAIIVCQNGVAHFLSTLLVKIVERNTGGTEEGWLRNDLNRSRLDSFYWLLCWITAVNLAVYLMTAWCYKGRDVNVGIADQKGAGEDATAWDGEREGSNRGSSLMSI